MSRLSHLLFLLRILGHEIQLGETYNRLQHLIDSAKYPRIDAVCDISNALSIWSRTQQGPMTAKCPMNSSIVIVTNAPNNIVAHG